MAEQIQFEIMTDLAQINPNKIITNYSDVKEWLTEQLKPYASMVVTEDAIGNAKTIRAKIRKVRDGINASKISAKKEWMRPFEEYEQQCKDLMAMCDAAANSLDEQVKSFENKAKEEKLAQCRAYFDSKTEGYPLLLPYIRFDDIVNPKWVNNTYKLEEIYEEIETAIKKVCADIRAIRGLKSKYEALLLDEYARAHDITAVLSKAETVRNRELAEAEAKAYEEKHRDDINIPVPNDSEILEPAQINEKQYTLDFRCYITKPQMVLLKQFFTENGIKFERIKNKRRYNQ